MYVNEEEVPLIAHAVVASKPNRVWLFIATCVALSTIGFAVVAVNGGLSSPSATKKLQMSLKGSMTYVNAPQIPLGECADFAVMAGTQVAFNGELTTIYTGDVGLSPGIIITGNSQLDSGTIEINSTKSNQCAADRIIAYNAAAAATCPASNIVTELGGLTLFPGVYCATSSAMTFFTGILTLDGQGDSSSVWVFQASSSLLISKLTSFILRNGATSANVFWQVSSSASLGSSSSFVGTIISYASVTVDTGVTLTGRTLAGAKVSFAGLDSVTLPTN